MITAFSINGIVGNINPATHTITLELPYGTALTRLVPVIVAPAGTTVDPANGVAQDFTAPVVYQTRFTDASGTLVIEDYTVTVTVSTEQGLFQKVLDNKIWVVGALLVAFFLYLNFGRGNNDESNENKSVIQTKEQTIPSYTTEGAKTIKMNAGDTISVFAIGPHTVMPSKDAVFIDIDDKPYNVKGKTYPEIKGRAWKSYMIVAKEDGTKIILRSVPKGTKSQPTTPAPTDSTTVKKG